jgi:hypothetical protein
MCEREGRRCEARAPVACSQSHRPRAAPGTFIALIDGTVPGPTLQEATTCAQLLGDHRLAGRRSAAVIARTRLAAWAAGVLFYADPRHDDCDALRQVRRQPRRQRSSAASVDPHSPEAGADRVPLTDQQTRINRFGQGSASLTSRAKVRGDTGHGAMSPTTHHQLRIPDQKRQGFRFKPATISDAIPPPRWPAEGLGRASAAEAPENPAR